MSTATQQPSESTEWEIWLTAIASATGRKREAAIAEAADLFSCTESEVQRRLTAFQRPRKNLGLRLTR